MRKLRFDAGSVEGSAEVAAGLAALGISSDDTPPGSQEKNPIERDNQSTKKTVATMLADQSLLGPWSWGLAMLRSDDSHNSTVNTLSAQINGCR